MGIGGKGRQAKTVNVLTNDRAVPTTTLEIAAMAKVAMMMDPPLVSFGEIPRDSAGPLTRTIHLKRADGGPIHPRVVPGPNMPAAAEVKEITPGEEYELVVTATPPFPRGMLTGRIAVSSGVEGAPDENVQVSGRMPPRLVTEPSRLTVPPGDINEPLELRAEVKWAGPPGKITNVKVDDPKLSVRLDTEHNPAAIVLSIPAGFKLAGRHRTVTINTDDPEVPALQVFVFGPRQPPPPGAASSRPAQGHKISPE